ncbi:nidogen-like domain-containing protein [Pararhodospirillum oryzae]|uniref:NIDO domain-containing protein n=1 Tax=Pararhodospirillum oryzae TaxID=478448 RepID=A0A512H807_9PROT|nr:nidogen-like domain-containing protein [Pararhodospirillum oryzae]GEO81530.1 hypothetical protein ROR02_16610 [Pararhodospirillum oryzae]
MTYTLSRTRNLVNGLGGSAGFGEGVLNRNDDSYQSVDISSVFTQGINFFGTTYTSIYVNNNGNITFSSGMGTYTPYAITGTTSNPIIAPFFADVDTRNSTVTSTTWSGSGNSTGTNNVYYDLDATNGVVTITWDDVGYYSNRTDLTNAFQLQIVRRNASDFDIAIRYEDVNWTTGSASGGTNGLGGTIARAGWSAGDGTNYYELGASGNQANMLDLDRTLGNTGTMGYWEFSVRNGQTENPWLNPLVNRNDFDGNGTADILWFNERTRQIAIWSMSGFDRIGAAAIQNTVNPQWSLAGTGDFDGNARTDILFRNTSTNALAVWSMDGLSRDTATVTGITLASTTHVVGCGDINNDGNADIFLHDFSTGTVSVALMGDNLTLQTPTTLQTNTRSEWTVGGMGDFNGDRYGDILWRNTSTGQVAIWLMQGTNRIGANVIQASVDLNWSLESTGDFNGDGTTDILWRHTDGRVANWLMNGLDRLGATIINSDSPLSSNWTIADTTDFNADGTDDILLRNSTTGGTAIWTMNNGTRSDGQLVQNNVLGEWSIANDLSYV